MVVVVFFFQAEDGIRDLVRSRGLGDVYKRQPVPCAAGFIIFSASQGVMTKAIAREMNMPIEALIGCLLYTSDAADERSSVDLGGRRIIKKKKREDTDVIRGLR